MVSRTTLCGIRPMTTADCSELLTMRLANRAFFEPWEPESAENLYTADGLRVDLDHRERDWQADRRYSFTILSPEGKAIGGIILSNVLRGAFQNATLGYYVAEQHNGKGVATEAVRQVVRFAFEERSLHRVEAGVMDHNPRSMRVLEKAGFERIGYAPRYLRIQGRWRDHHIYAITRERWEAESATQG